MAVYRCAGCGAASPQWTGRCPGCGAWNTLGEERTAPASAATGRPVQAAVPIARVGRGRVGAPLHRHRRARPGAGRRAGPRLGHAPRRGARHRQVHPPAPDGGGAGPGGIHRPLRVGRGVRTPGEAPGRAARCAARPVVVRLRHVAARPDRPPRPGAARGVRGRLDPVGARPHAQLRAGQRRTGARVGPPARAGVQGARRRHGARGSRHEGRGAGRAPPARAPRRHGAVVRGRPPPRRSGCSVRSSTASAPPTIWASSR